MLDNVMLGHLGFSYVGMIYLVMLIVPNLIWAKVHPQGPEQREENKILLWFERFGQVSVTCLAPIFSDFNLKPFSACNLWLIASFALMVMYECFWIRYFRHPKEPKNLYGSFCGVPIAGATLPVAAFLLLGIYGKVIWMIGAAIILGIGHIGIHIRHIRALNLNIRLMIIDDPDFVWRQQKDPKKLDEAEKCTH